MTETIHHARLAQAFAIELDAKSDLPQQIKILPVGEFSTTKYGPLAISDEQLAHAVANYEAVIPTGAPINLDHMYGEAAGWFKGYIHVAHPLSYEAILPIIVPQSLPTILLCSGRTYGAFCTEGIGSRDGCFHNVNPPFTPRQRHYEELWRH